MQQLSTTLSSLLLPVVGRSTLNLDELDSTYSIRSRLDPELLEALEFQMRSLPYMSLYRSDSGTAPLLDASCPQAQPPRSAFK